MGQVANANVINLNCSIDLIKNPILGIKWEAFKRIAKPGELDDILEVERRGKNRVHKLYFKTKEFEQAVRNYFSGTDVLDEEDLEISDDYGFIS